MNERERLAELIHKAELAMWGKPVGDAKSQREFIADYLLDHGVIAPPCKVGDIIYAFTYDGKYYMPLKVTRRESLVRWMDEDQFGNALFTTREEAEAALAERRKA